jgi:hypothetical protein
VERGAYLGSPRYLYGVKREPTSIGSSARLRRTPKNNRRATNSDCRTSGSSASHYRASPAHGPLQSSSGSTPYLPLYIRAQRSREVNARLPPQGHNTPGFGTPLKRPYQVLSRRVKTLQLLVRRSPVTVSTDRVKPAYTHNGADRGSHFNPPDATYLAAAPSATPPQISTNTTRSGRHIHFPARLNNFPQCKTDNSPCSQSQSQRVKVTLELTVSPSDCPDV